MADFSDYGISLGYCTTGSLGGPFTVFAGVLEIDPPSIKNETIKIVTHDKAYERNIASKVIRLGDAKMKLSYNKDTTSASTINFVTTGSNISYQVTFPNSEKWAFTGNCVEFAPSTAVADKPNQLIAEVTFACDGNVLLS